MEETRIHWADVIARATEGLQVIATGITPSGNIHVGNMREVVTADAIFRAIKDVGKAARLIYVADSYDPLRTVYPFLPTSYKEYVGMPLSEIPDPFGCCSSYAEHYLKPVSYTHLRAHETVLDLVCRLLLEKKKKKNKQTI